MAPDDHSYAPVARGKSADSGVTIVPSVCPHDCTSTCALDVERLDARTIGRVRGSTRNTYTAGVICEKVGRYAERIHHPDRLLHPLRRVGPKGSAQFARISWEEALDRVAEAFAEKAARHGSETVWPYFYAGTMGLVQRDGIQRLRHAMKYSRWFSTICVTLMKKNGSAPTIMPSTRSLHTVANALSISLLFVAFKTRSFTPSFSAAFSRMRVWASKRAFVGLARYPMVLASGTISCRTSNRLISASFSSCATPVTFPPGWARLSTKPLPTGSIAYLRQTWLDK
jgi:hypothetical protein